MARAPTARDSDQAAVDAAMMGRCLELARRAEGRTAPNPIVGSVVVDAGGAVVAEGWHRRAGAAHAEIAALAKIRRHAPGGTLYVNLEPCNHHGRTPPCAPAVLASGVTRVVIGAMDPVAGHGGGARLLAKAGVEVVRGVLRAECEDANAPFITWARHRRAHFLLKAAITLDGKIATVAGESQWITGDEARVDVHRMRDRCDAVLVGVGTVLADDPQLTVRGIASGRDPVRVVVDSRLRTPASARLLPANADGAPVRTILACASATPQRRRKLEAAGAEIWELPGADGRVDLAALARRLGGADLLAVLVEGGGEVHAGLLAAGLADQLRLYVAPVVVGGPAPSWLGGAGVRRLADAPRLRWLAAPERVGADLVLRAAPLPPSATGRAPAPPHVASVPVTGRRR
jgi:diaminohydroxyphosphoribosylaminopyrimidine deaminase/5-amino-6-(5-phosphoribosylamino)uracil reductase